MNNLGKNSLERIKDYPKVEIDFNPKFENLKKIKDKTAVNVRYCLVKPFAFAHIYWNEKELELIYEVEEPELTPEEEKYRDELVSSMREVINFDNVVEKDQDKLLEYINKMEKILAIELGMNLSYEAYKKFTIIYAEIFGI
jgi:heat shock protein HspQ